MVAHEERMGVNEQVRGILLAGDTWTLYFRDVQAVLLMI